MEPENAPLYFSNFDFLRLRDGLMTHDLHGMATKSLETFNKGGVGRMDKQTAFVIYGPKHLLFQNSVSCKYFQWSEQF